MSGCGGPESVLPPPLRPASLIGTLGGHHVSSESSFAIGRDKLGKAIVILYTTIDCRGCWEIQAVLEELGLAHEAVIPGTPYRTQEMSMASLRQESLGKEEGT